MLISQLEKLCVEQGQKFDRFDVHQALGKRFFDWTLNKQIFEDVEMDPFRHAYNERFCLFLDEMTTFLKANMGINVKAIYVGGENSQFIEPFSQVTVLNTRLLHEVGIVPEIIQLLGCLKLSRMHDFHIETYPSYDEIMRHLKEDRLE